MSASNIADSPRVSLPSAVDWEDFQRTQAELQAEQRQQQQREQQTKLIWVEGLAGHAKRNSLGSITTRRRGSNSSSSGSIAAAAGDADSEQQQLQQHHGIGGQPAVRQLRRLDPGSQSPRQGRRTAGQTGSPSYSAPPSRTVSPPPLRAASDPPSSSRLAPLLSSPQLLLAADSASCTD